jgi:hypothetical protein
MTMSVRFLALAAVLVAIAGEPFAACAQDPPPGGSGPGSGGPFESGKPPQGGPGPDQGGGTPPQHAPTSYWGAIGFTADGSWSAAWKMPSKAEAEASAAVGCAKFGHGECKVVSFSGEFCVGLATFIGTSGRRRWQLSFTEGATTSAEAQKAAVGRCNDDQRTRQRCQLRTVVCADGR